MIQVRLEGLIPGLRLVEIDSMQSSLLVTGQAVESRLPLVAGWSLVMLPSPPSKPSPSLNHQFHPRQHSTMLQNWPDHLTEQGLIISYQSGLAYFETWPFL